MNWLATLLALLVQKLSPWIYGLIGSGITAIVAYFEKKQQARTDAKQREEATKALEKAIKEKAERDERQKREENLLNS